MRLRRVILILLALVVLAPSIVEAATRYRCASDGRVRTTCCCPGQAKRHRAPVANPELKAASCCKITRLEAYESAVRAEPPITVDGLPLIAPVAVTLTPIEAPIRIAAIERPRVPRGPPEALFARHCSRLL